MREFLKLKEAGGSVLGEEEALEIMGKRRYYGVFDEKQLVSIACSYLRTADVWLTGDVYTHPAYRGRGYAKAATSAITRDTVVSGARALLHVAADNEPALRVYRALGYRAVSRKPRMFYSPRGG